MNILPIIEFPPELDLNYYRQSYPELNVVPEDILKEHCDRFAIEQGRSTCIYDRREQLQKLLQNVINKYHLKTLEISPWDNPFICGDSVKYFDGADPETLRKNSEEVNRPFNSVPEKIDFISPNYDLSIIDENFDIVFSSHVIEHTVDLIKHLQCVSNILNQGGLYILIIPDKRYCFDYYQTESTIAKVIDAFVYKRKLPSIETFINYNFCGVTHNNPFLHWLGNHSEEQPSDSTCDEFWQEIDEYTEALENDRYINNHNWQFTPNSFGYIIRTLKKLKFIDLSLYRLCHTIWGRFEFVAILEKC